MIRESLVDTWPGLNRSEVWSDDLHGLPGKKVEALDFARHKV
jgi:hypothetical protein